MNLRSWIFTVKHSKKVMNGTSNKRKIGGKTREITKPEGDVYMCTGP